MNKEETKELFKREAILFGAVDGIPETRAVEILGQEAVDFAHRMDGQNGTYFNGFGIGQYTAHYMTLAGLYIAVTYNNLMMLEKG